MNESMNERTNERTNRQDKVKDAHNNQVGSIYVKYTRSFCLLVLCRSVLFCFALLLRQDHLPVLHVLHVAPEAREHGLEVLTVDPAPRVAHNVGHCRLEAPQRLGRVVMLRLSPLDPPLQLLQARLDLGPDVQGGHAIVDHRLSGWFGSVWFIVYVYGWESGGRRHWFLKQSISIQSVSSLI